jgi:phosphohistidine phosphatase
MRVAVFCRTGRNSSANPTQPMHLLVIRHAIATDREEFARTGEPDESRPLTASGRKRMERIAVGLPRLVPELDLLASSPLTRARETAGIVARVYPAAVRETVPALRPDERIPAFLEWVRTRTEEKVAVVGHEPHLSHLVSWLLAGRFASFLRLRKGAACLLDLGEVPSPGEAELIWLLQPRQLRHLPR